MRNAEDKNLYATEQAKENLKRLCKEFDCDSVASFAQKGNALSSKYAPLPSLSTMNAFLTKNSVTKRTIELLTNFYNKVYNDTISVHDFSHKELLFQKRYRHDDLYTGAYLCITQPDHFSINQLDRLGVIYIEPTSDSTYAVRALLRLKYMSKDEFNQIKALLEDSSVTLNDILNASIHWNPDDNYYGYFVGEMKMERDYYVIKLERDASLLNDTTYSDIQIYLRKIAKDMRNKNNGMMGLKIRKSSGLDILTKRILLSSKFIPLEDTHVQQLLHENSNLHILDEEDFKWDLYVKHYVEKE